MELCLTEIDQSDGCLWHQENEFMPANCFTRLQCLTTCTPVS